MAVYLTLRDVDKVAQESRRAKPSIRRTDQIALLLIASASEPGAH